MKDEPVESFEALVESMDVVYDALDDERVVRT
jgi:hypothetical protein